MAESEFYRLDIVTSITGDGQVKGKLTAMDRFIEQTRKRGEVLNRMKVNPTITLNDRISAPLRTINDKLKTLGNTAKTTSSRISGFFTSLPGMFGLGAVTLGPAALISKMISTAGEFEQAMANVASVAGASREEMGRLTQAALKMGKTTQFKASEAADALYYLASAGFTVDQQIAALSGTLGLAAATQADLAFTSETVAAALSGFGMKAEETNRVANVFAATISKSQATIYKLSDSMRYAGPIAGSFGMSIESTSAALGILYNAGLRGEQAGTTLRGALTALANPAGQTKDALKKLGLSADQLNPALHSIADIIETLERRGIDTATAMQLFGTEAGSGMMAMIKQGSAALRKMEKDITGTNKAVEMAEMQMDTLFGSIKYLQSAWEALSISLGISSIPGVRRLSNFLKTVIDDSDRLAKIVGDRLNRAFNRFADILESPEFKEADWGGKIVILLDEAIRVAVPKAGEAGVKIAAAFAQGLVSGILEMAERNPLVAAGVTYIVTPGSPYTKGIAAAVVGGTGGLMKIGEKVSPYIYGTEDYVERQMEPWRALSEKPAGKPMIEGGELRAARHQFGGIFTRPHLGLFAEAGPEAVIPLSSRLRSRGLDLLKQTSRYLGVQSYAFGGFTGPVAVAAAGSAGNVDVMVSGITVNLLANEIEIDEDKLALRIGRQIVHRIKRVLENKT